MIKIDGNTISGTTEDLLILKDQLIHTLKENRRQTKWPYFFDFDEDINIKIINEDIPESRP